MKQTQENNGKKCSKTEYLVIEIHNHFKNPHSYVIWNKDKVLGEADEDGVIQILKKTPNRVSVFSKKEFLSIFDDAMKKQIKLDWIKFNRQAGNFSDLLIE